MRSARLLALTVLAVLLAASPLAHAQNEGVFLMKVTTNGDTTTEFQFAFSQVEGPHGSEMLRGGETLALGDLVGIWTIVETVPGGWVLVGISCTVDPQGETVVTVDLANAMVTIERGVEEVNQVRCYFTNSPVGGPVGAPVGGLIEPVNRLAVLTPYLALLGAVAAVAVAVVAPWKRPQP